jgi:hypothetical protein
MTEQNKKENPRFSPTYDPATLKNMKIEMIDAFVKNHPHLPIILQGELTPQGAKPVLSCLPEPKKPAKLENVDLSRKEMAQIENKIGVLALSVICGTIFGDSSININTGYAEARMQNKHSTRQQTWFFWKWMVALRQLHRGVSSITLQNPNKKQSVAPLLPDETFLGCLKISSGAREELTVLRKIICDGDRKKIERSWLNHMSDYFLMVLWVDDGGLHSDQNSQGRISTNSTPVEEQRVLADYLETVWQIKTKVTEQTSQPLMSNGQRPYAIEIADTENLLTLLRIVAPLIPIREMLYKVQFVPKSNMSLLQRWASEVTELVQPQFRDEMKAFYSKKLEEYNR